MRHAIRLCQLAVLLLTRAQDVCASAKTNTFSGNLSPFTGSPRQEIVFGYDAGDRLTSERTFSSNNTLTNSVAYGYDAASNRTSKTANNVVSSCLYDDCNQLTTFNNGATPVAYTYDANGNRATRVTGGHTDFYGYDGENRLISLVKSTSGIQGTFNYLYDYRTRRVARTEGSTRTDVVFSGGLSVFERVGGQMTAEYIRGSDWGGGVAGLLYTLRNGVPSYVHYNRRGDVTTRTNTAGAITYQANYTTEGRRSAEFGSTLDRQKANTKEEDPTGLLNEGFRYRDLETLTFITRDPAGFADGPNLYAYVRQNPWTKFDPEGLAGEDAGSRIVQHSQMLNDLINGDDPEAHEHVAQQIQGGQRAAGVFAEGGSTAIGLTPIENASEALTGKDAAGKKVGWGGQLIAIGGVIAGPAEKLAGKLINEAKGLLKMEKTASDSVKESAQLVKNVEKDEAAFAKYEDVPDPKSVGEGKDFTPATKRKILEKNKEKNGGSIKSDQSGAEAVPSQKSQSGVTPPQNEAQIDHVVPKSKGGTNSPSNAQVLTREENRAKSNN